MRKDPAFRAQFHAMCANVGVDPLASNKGAWAQLLGFGDFYYELGVQVRSLPICRPSTVFCSVECGACERADQVQSVL